jgi:hypothetical protein
MIVNPGNHRMNSRTGHSRPSFFVPIWNLAVADSTNEGLEAMNITAGKIANDHHVDAFSEDSSCDFESLDLDSVTCCAQAYI